MKSEEPADNVAVMQACLFDEEVAGLLAGMLPIGSRARQDMILIRTQVSSMLKHPPFLLNPHMAAVLLCFTNVPSQHMENLNNYWSQ